MLRDGYLIRLRYRAPVATLLFLMLLTTGCSSGGGAGAPAVSAAPPPAPSLTEKFSSIFSSSSPKPQAAAATGTAAAPQQDVDCPLIDIRQGASTLQIPPPSGDNGTLSLKYQGTFVRAARECAVVNKQMVMKVGIEGRVIVGPAGGPGQVDVPLRIAVVQEKTASTKTIFTKFIRKTVEIPPGSDGTNFTHVEEGITFPLPPASDIDSYIVYIGYDPLTAEAEDKARSKPKPKPKPKVKPAPTG